MNTHVWQTARPGDILTRPKALFVHKGLYLGWGRVLHNTPERGVHISSIDEFAIGKLVTIVPVADDTRTRALNNVNAGIPLPQPYDFLRNNCEHTVTRLVADHPHSPQLFWWGFGIAAISALALAYRANTR